MNNEYFIIMLGGINNTHKQTWRCYIRRFEEMFTVIDSAIPFASYKMCNSCKLKKQFVYLWVMPNGSLLFSH